MEEENKLWYSHIIKYHIAIKNSTLPIHAVTWINVMGTVEWKKPGTKSQILFGPTDMNLQAKLIHGDRGQNGSYIGLLGQEAKEPTGSWTCSTSWSGFWLHIVSISRNWPGVMALELLFGGMKVLGSSGDGCTISWLWLMQLTFALKIIKMANFGSYILHNTTF